MSTTNSTSPSQTSTQPSPSCTTASPGKYGYVPPDACNANYNYSPNFEAAVATSVLFGILMVAHIVAAFFFKKRYCWVLIMGAIWELIAFITLAIGAHNQQNVGLATAHVLLFLLAPLWINAFVYMTFARLVNYYIPEKKIVIKAASMAKYFVLADILSFIVQAIGGVMTTPGSSPSTVQTGLHIYTGGVGLQQLFIVVFTGLMVAFQRRVMQLEAIGELSRDRSWRPLQYSQYCVLIAISVRIIYRVLEFARGVGPSNPLPLHEAYSYALDAFPMMVALLIILLVHPGWTLGPESEFPKKSRAERKAEKRAKKDEKIRKKDERLFAKMESKQKKIELKRIKAESKAARKGAVVVGSSAGLMPQSSGVLENHHAHNMV